MTQEIQWGPAIAVDGKRPEFVRAEDVCAVRQSNPKDWLGLEGRIMAAVWGWGPIKECKLPADHPHYRQTEEAPIDWSGELEAVHEDGRVVPVTLVEIDRDGDRYISPTLPDGYELFHADGSSWSGGPWRIRNAPQPAPQADTKPSSDMGITISPDLTAEERAIALVRKFAKGDFKDDTYLGVVLFEKLYAEARAIVALLPEPVDPDRAVVDAIMAEAGWYEDADHYVYVAEIALSALARGRALALAGEKEA